MFTPLHSSMNHKLFEKHLCNQSSHCKKIQMVLCAPVIVWKWSIHYAFRQLCLTSYTAIPIKNCLKCTSAIKVATMKDTDGFHYAKEAIMCKTKSQHFLLSAKMNGIQRRTLVSPWRMYCMYCSIPKDTDHYQVMLVWRHQAGRQMVSQYKILLNRIFLKFCSKHFGSI